MRTVRANTWPEGRWWVFEIPELKTGGQAKKLTQVRFEAQGVAAMWLDEKPGNINVEVEIKVPDDALSEWQAAENDEDEARLAQSRAAKRRRAVIKQLYSQGWSATETAAALGISRQRVYQLLAIGD